MKAAWWTMILTVLTLLACAQPDSEPQGANADSSALNAPALILEPVKSWSLPSGRILSLQGASFVSDSIVVGWTRDGKLWLFDRGDSIAEPIWERAPLIIVRSGFPGREQPNVAVSNSDGRVFRIRPSGSVEATQTTCDVAARSADLLSVGEDLLALRNPANGEPTATASRSLSLIRLSGGNCQEVANVELGCRDGVASLAQAGPDEAWISCSDPDVPIHSVKLSSDSLVLEGLKLSGAADGSPELSSPTTPLWFALPVVRLDRGFLRVQADLRSSARRIELIDSQGRIVRTSLVETPLGLVASRPEDRLLFGMRGAPGAEALLFEWSWSE